MTSPRAFISYAKEDVEEARRLYTELRAHGIDAWIDIESMLPGTNWKRSIKYAIENSDFFIAVLSANSVSKTGYVQKELLQAIEYLDLCPPDRIYLIPVRIDECKPVHDRLRDIHWVDLFMSWEEGLRKIISAIHDERIDSQLKHDSLLISDGSEFSKELGVIFGETGFSMRTIPISGYLQERHLNKKTFVIFTQGEHFVPAGNMDTYNKLVQFVYKGGIVLFTAWSAWSAQRSKNLSDVLPVEIVDGKFREDKLVSCVRTEHSAAKDVFADGLDIQISFEILKPRPSAVTLLTTREGVPIFSYCKTGEGVSLYLNCCQHSCISEMKSPFEENIEYWESIRRLSVWISNTFEFKPI